ncbi:hypothetical protein G4B88_005685 [Cannabis sativa]|uniref:Uncharacterized protein n=1 Tax=Cannabis sativa TaxID=3483 RepID=A0A7J6ELR2_CANSA|nr:hypothetical protein G4B88_005685 [Cannabis sativa]
MKEQKYVFEYRNALSASQNNSKTVPPKSLAQNPVEIEDDDDNDRAAASASQNPTTRSKENAKALANASQEKRENPEIEDGLLDGSPEAFPIVNFESFGTQHRSCGSFNHGKCSSAKAMSSRLSSSCDKTSSQEFGVNHSNLKHEPQTKCSKSINDYLKGKYYTPNSKSIKCQRTKVGIQFENIASSAYLKNRYYIPNSEK